MNTLAHRFIHYSLQAFMSARFAMLPIPGRRAPLPCSPLGSPPLRRVGFIWAFRGLGLRGMFYTWSWDV